MAMSIWSIIATVICVLGFSWVTYISFSEESVEEKVTAKDDE